MKVFYSVLFYSRLCPSTAGSSPPPGSSNFLCFLLSLFIPLPAAPQCHLSNDVLVFQLMLCLYLLFCDCNAPPIILYSGDVSSPFPFRIGYALEYVCHYGSLPNDGVAVTVFYLDIKHSSFHDSLACLKFFTNSFVRDHVCHPYVTVGKTHWLKTFLFRLIGRCQPRKISVYFPKTPDLAFIFKFCSVFHCCCLFQIFIISHLLYFCPVYLYVVCCVNICHKFSFSFMYLEPSL